MKANLMPLPDALRLVATLTAREPDDVKEDLRLALFEGVVGAEGHVDRHLYLAPKWEPIAREFWVEMPDWNQGTTASSTRETVRGIHVNRADLEDVFGSTRRRGDDSEWAGSSTLRRLAGVEDSVTSPRGWLLPDALRVFCPDQYTAWREFACAAKRGEAEIDMEFTLLGETIEALRRRLISGTLVASGIADGNTETEDVPADSWHRLSSLGLLEFSESTFDDGTTLFREVRVRAVKMRLATARAETSCEKWFLERVRTNQRPPSRDAMYEDAKREIGKDLSKRAFQRVWKKQAPEDWTAPGARKVNRRT